MVMQEYYNKLLTTFYWQYCCNATNHKVTLPNTAAPIMIHNVFLGVFYPKSSTDRYEFLMYVLEAHKKIAKSSMSMSIISVLSRLAKPTAGHL